MNLNNEIRAFLVEKGAIKVGFATKETMRGDPPGADISYLLKEAKSAVCFALPLDKTMIRAFLRKELPYGRADHERDNIQTNQKAFQLAKELSAILKQKGFKAIPVIPNNKYREDIPGWRIKMPPEVSLRYLAVRSGVGSFGWSGNVGIKDIGTTIILGGVVTDAELTATDPVPHDEEFCTKCKICTKVCALRMFSDSKEVEINLGGYAFRYAERIDKRRCHIVCGGFSGLDKTMEWSTWSPGRYPYPETEKELSRLYSISIGNAAKWPKNEDGSNGYDDPKLGGKVQLTCGNCQIICWGDPKETAKNYKILKNSGCIVQEETGELKRLSKKEAEDYFNSLPKKRRKLYYKNYKK
ncbi:MAG: hypothetical protein BAJALOKI2v1_420009 [Promethearchaeota archaeon]|nr:MAG: hypothetical protein BAJALOKI2v1_420009 [Candidatus Lokiarchaeota archaeon]